MKVYFSNEIDPKKLSSSKNTKEYAKSYRVFIDYDKKPLYINTPKMRIPFDIKEVKGGDGKIWAREMTLSVGPLTDQDSQNNKHVEYFKKIVEKIDDRISKLIKGEMRHSLYSSNPNYAPTFTTKIKNTFGSDTPNIKVFDQKKKLIPLEKVNFNLRSWVVSLVIKLDGVWVQKEPNPETKKNKFGIDWTVVQMRIHHAQPCGIVEKKN